MASPRWEVKGAISLHLWQDAEHARWFRTRITEMRTPPHHLDRTPDPALAVFVGQLRQARNTLELLAGIYEITKAALAEGFRAHLAEAHPLTDHPTRRLVRFAFLEEEEQLAWGHAALAALAKQHPAEAAALAGWRNHLQAYLAAAGGIQGTEPRPAAAALPAPRTGSTATTHVPRQDSRFPARLELPRGGTRRREPGARAHLVDDERSPERDACLRADPRP